MGRHSSHSQWPFYRSILGWAMPWLFVAAAIAVAIWFTVDALGGDGDAPVVAEASETPSRTPERSVVPSPTEEPEAKPSKEAKPEASPSEAVALITDNMTVQVLNGSNDPAADDTMASQLAANGFEVVAVQGSSIVYEATTVFWSYAESQQAAEALGARFGWHVAPKPENLSTSVALHVVVGEDYVPE